MPVRFAWSAMCPWNRGVRRYGGAVMAGRIEHPGRSGRAGGLLDRAERMLLQASAEPDPRERFRTAYLAALRGAGAVLAFTGADRAPRARSRNAWVLMQ